MLVLKNNNLRIFLFICFILLLSYLYIFKYCGQSCIEKFNLLKTVKKYKSTPEENQKYYHNYQIPEFAKTMDVNI